MTAKIKRREYKRKYRLYPVHGRRLAEVYRQAILKAAKRAKGE